MGLFKKREDAGSTRVQCPQCGHQQNVDKGAISVFCKRCMHRISAKTDSGQNGLGLIPASSPQHAPTKKTEIECPKCGILNKAAEDAVSIFCKKCQNIIYLKKEAPPIKSLNAKSANGKTRTITCYSCSNRQSVSTSALSAFCSSCGNRIDLKDWEIKNIYHEQIMTRGNLHVARNGRINAEINVMSARIDGEVHGNIIAEDKLEIGAKGKVFGNIIARRMQLHKGAFYSGNIRLNADKIS